MYAQSIVAASVVVAGVIAISPEIAPAPDAAEVPRYEPQVSEPEPVAEESLLSFKIEVVPYTEEDLRCLAENLYFESRGEPHAGQIAVGLVTMNRVHSPAYPDTVCDVVYHKVKGVCQFSWFCDEHPDVIRSRKSWETTVELARRILQNEFYDITEGATYFHADYVNPGWNQRLERTVTIDRHIFYRDPKDVYRNWNGR